MKPKPLLMLCGMLAPVVYVFAVVIGGLLSPDYSHKSQAISELIEAGAPNKWLLDPLFALYNLLTGAFAVGLLGSVVLAFEAVVGFVTVFFPQDPPGSPPTPTGATHIALAGLSSLATMATILLVGLWFRKTFGLGGYGAYSFVTVAVIFVSGGLAAWAVATGNPFAGVFERVTIGAFLQWLVVVALKMYRSGTASARR